MRVTKATWGTNTQTWKYDAVGNITEFDDKGSKTLYSYTDNNLNFFTDNKGDEQETTVTFDRSGRTQSTVLVSLSLIHI